MEVDIQVILKELYYCSVSAAGTYPIVGLGIRIILAKQEKYLITHYQSADIPFQL